MSRVFFRRKMEVSAFLQHPFSFTICHFSSWTKRAFVLLGLLGSVGDALRVYGLRLPLDDGTEHSLHSWTGTPTEEVTREGRVIRCFDIRITLSSELELHIFLVVTFLCWTALTQRLMG